MAITKEYDEMTDITKYFSPVMRVGSNKFLGKYTKQMKQIHISIQIVIGIDKGEPFSALIFARRGHDWAWVGNSNTIFLVDGVRTTGEGIVVKSFTSNDGTNVYCNEYVTQRVDLKELWTISNAESVKFRVGSVDVVPPEEFIPNLKEILDHTKEIVK